MNMARIIIGTALVFGTVVTPTMAPTAAAATIITVDTAADTRAVDGFCSLREAVEAANFDSQNFDCPAGSGADIIVLAATGPYVLATPLPGFDTDIELIGNGATIDHDGGAGAITVDFDATVSIDGLTLTGSNNGGVLNVGDLSATNMTFDSNPGGGIANLGELVVRDSTFTNNGSGAVAGGGLFNSGLAAVHHSLIRNNTTTGSGGGIFNQPSGVLTVSDSTISGNTADDWGGGVYNDGIVMIDRVAIVDNTSTSRFGGGIYNGETATLTNTTISGNDAPTSFGGGIYTDGAMNISFSTITNNTSSSVPGIAARGEEPTVTTVEASIISGNVGGHDVARVVFGDIDPFVSNGYNIIGTAGTGTSAFDGDLVGVDPVLGPLTDNGGSSPTHQPLAGSPAIELVAGALAGAPALDQRGVARPQGAYRDAGAFEACGPSPWSVATGVQLNAAIGCFNELTTGGLHEIVVAADIAYDRASPTIEWPPNFAELMIQGNGYLLDASETGTVIRIGLNARVEIDDLSLTGGLAAQGGGIYSLGYLTLNNSTVTGNTATSTGGGIYVSRNAEVVGSTISANTAHISGGGVTAVSVVTIASSIISDNTTLASNSVGGGLMNTGILTIADSAITGNSAVSAGGGLHDVGETVEITGTTVSGNTAGSQGGGLSTNGFMTVTGSTVSGNSASFYGGIRIWDTAMVTLRQSAVTDNGATVTGGGIGNRGSLVMTDSTASGNSAGGPGGALFNSGTATISNSTFSGNDASRGGAIGADGETDIAFSTITNNTATNGSGVSSGSTSNTFVEASIVAGNQPSGSDVQLANELAGDTFDSGGGNVIGSVGPAVVAFDDDLAGEDAVLGALADNGGPTLTHALLSGSPAIDRAAGTFVDDQTTDQRGTARPIGPAKDAGAYEWFGDIDGDTVIDTADNCPSTANPDQADTDGDSVGDACDPDDDNDTVIDTEDNCPGDANADQADLDGDSVGDACDPDDDNDTVIDTADNCPSTANPDQADTDGDSVGDACDPDDDNDTVIDTEDNCPGDANADQADLDGDSVGDACDPDDDNDTVFDTADNCPSTANPDQADTDGDSAGDACDPTDERAVLSSSTPRRYADSRNEDTFDNRYRNTGPRSGGTSWEIQIAGRGAVPAEATAAVINLTVLNGQAAGFATAYPCTASVPNASSVNYLPGAVEPNEIITKLSATGTICVFTLTAADVIIDVVGHVTDSPYIALAPTRYADSRDEATFDNRHRNTGTRKASTTWEIPIGGRGTIPASAAAVAINLTVTGGTTEGFATVHPCGTLPLASSLNYGPGVTRPNELITKLSATGTICVYTLTDVDVIVDVVGYLPDDATGYTAIVPTRYADSRNENTFDNTHRNTGIRKAGTTWEIPIAGRGTIPAAASTATINLTVTGATDHGFATVHPCGTLPLASSINYGPGITRPNELITKLSPTGTICIYTLTHVDVIIDVVGHN